LLIGEYFQQIGDWLAPQLTSGLLVRIEGHMEGRSPTLGYLRLKLVWSNGSELHVREFIDADPQPGSTLVCVSLSNRRPAAHFPLR
jgi:hypothetical protein